MKIWELLLVTIFVLGVCFLAGVDDGLDKMNQERVDKSTLITTKGE